LAAARFTSARSVPAIEAGPMPAKAARAQQHGADGNRATAIATAAARVPAERPVRRGSMTASLQELDGDDGE